MADDDLCFNGINGSTGEYSMPPMSGEELANFIKGGSNPENLAELRFRQRRTREEGHFGIEEGLDPLDLAQAGWAILFPANADPAIREALQPLLDHRQAQAGELFKVFEGADAVRPAENKNSFLKRHGVGPGPAQPAKLPYYVLIAGSPDAIDDRFQSQLAVQYAVGRLHFDKVEDYAAYAQAVVAAEKGGARRPRRMQYFAVANKGDKATRMSLDMLSLPLTEKLAAKRPSWQFPLIEEAAATKAALHGLLTGGDLPACLFTASHGMGFDLGDARQIPHQGALLCQDWPGPSWKETIPQDFYYAGDDLPSSTRLDGLISFHFACYGAGTPQFDEFSKQAFKKREAIAPNSFVAGLPQAMLRQGALAFVGHIERAWSYSFRWPGAGTQTAVFESLFGTLLRGAPIGHALDPMNLRHAEISVMLVDQLEEAEFGADVDPYELSGMWTANNDARGWALLGDPAVKLDVEPE